MALLREAALMYFSWDHVFANRLNGKMSQERNDFFCRENNFAVVIVSKYDPARPDHFVQINKDLLLNHFA